MQGHKSQLIATEKAFQKTYGVSGIASHLTNSATTSTLLTISIAVETRLCWLAVGATAAESSLRQAIVRHWCAVVGLNHAPALSTRLLTPTEFTIC